MSKERIQCVFCSEIIDTLSWPEHYKMECERQRMQSMSQWERDIQPQKLDQSKKEDE